MKLLPDGVPPPYTGGCLCGALRFRLDAPLAPIQVCHCRQCRKAQGGPFATNIPVPRAAFAWLDEPSTLQRYASSPGKWRAFCGRCGSPLYSERDAMPATIRVRAGLIDQPLLVGPDAHAHVASQCNWWPIDDDLPQHPAGR